MGINFVRNQSCTYFGKFWITCQYVELFVVREDIADGGSLLQLKDILMPLLVINNSGFTGIDSIPLIECDRRSL